MATEKYLLVISADRKVRISKRPRIFADEIAIPVVLEYPPNWGRVLKDEALTEIAAHPPETPEALERIRAVPKGFANSRLGKGLMEAIAEGLHAPPPQGAIDDNKQRRRREPEATQHIASMDSHRASAFYARLN